MHHFPNAIFLILKWLTSNSSIVSLPWINGSIGEAVWIGLTVCQFSNLVTIALRVLRRLRTQCTQNSCKWLSEPKLYIFGECKTIPSIYHILILDYAMLFILIKTDTLKMLFINFYRHFTQCVNAIVLFSRQQRHVFLNVVTKFKLLSYWKFMDFLRRSKSRISISFLFFFVSFVICTTHF